MIIPPGKRKTGRRGAADPVVSTEKPAMILDHCGIGWRKGGHNELEKGDITIIEMENKST